MICEAWKCNVNMIHFLDNDAQYVQSANFYFHDHFRLFQKYMLDCRTVCTYMYDFSHKYAHHVRALHVLNMYDILLIDLTLSTWNEVFIGLRHKVKLYLFMLLSNNFADLAKLIHFKLFLLLMMMMMMIMIILMMMITVMKSLITMMMMTMTNINNIELYSNFEIQSNSMIELQRMRRNKVTEDNSSLGILIKF